MRIEENKIILKAENVFKSFLLNDSTKKKIEILKDISIDIVEKNINIILGASGAGKTTLLNIFGTLEKPTSGNIFYNFKNITDLTENEICKIRNMEFGFVFQYYHLFQEFSVLENVMMPMLISGKKISEAKEKAEYFLNEVKMFERKVHKPSELSGGEQQRVAVARALTNQPKIIFADEPTGNLDSENAEILENLFFKLNQKNGQTFLIVTHSEKFSKIGNKIFTIVDGKILE